MFVDVVRIHAKAGSGGNGCIAFRREKFVPRGGPSGGDGGYGGHVILEGDEGQTTLVDLHGAPSFRARDGENGQSKNRHGADGESLVLKVPLGTVVHSETEDGEDVFICEVLAHGERLIVAHGGRGGKGNIHFATSTRRAPRIAKEGQPGEELHLRIELKILAQVGLVGLPNAGKSTLLNAICRTRSKVAAYPFTTLHPVLGTIRDISGKRIILADIPGIVEGAHTGVGLGTDFLRHIERTETLLYVVDAAPTSGLYPLDALRALVGEIREYDKSILKRPRIIALNKIDLLPDGAVDQEVLKSIDEENLRLGGEYEIHAISAAENRNLEPLVDSLIGMVNRASKEIKLTPEQTDEEL